MNIASNTSKMQIFFFPIKFNSRSSHHFSWKNLRKMITNLREWEFEIFPPFFFMDETFQLENERELPSKQIQYKIFTSSINLPHNKNNENYLHLCCCCFYYHVDVDVDVIEKILHVLTWLDWKFHFHPHGCLIRRGFFQGFFCYCFESRKISSLLLSSRKDRLFLGNYLNRILFLSLFEYFAFIYESRVSLVLLMKMYGGERKSQEITSLIINRTKLPQNNSL